jgi:hypothetical protein
MSNLSTPSTAPVWGKAALAAKILAGSVFIWGLLWYAFVSVLRLPIFFPPPLLVVAYFPILFAMVAVHEVGHLVAAGVVRFPIVGIRVWPLHRTCDPVWPELRLDTSDSLPAGFVQVTIHDGIALRPRMLLFLAGGPLANLLVGLLCLVLAGFANRAMPSRDVVVRQGGSWGVLEPVLPQNWTNYWFNVTGFVALGIGVANLVPHRWRRWDSDGAQLLHWLRSGPPAERDLITRTLHLAMRQGYRPRQWHHSLVRGLLLARRGGAQDVLANLYGCYHALDTGQYEEAGRLLDLAFSQREFGAGMYRAAILVEVAYFENRYRRNPWAGRVWLGRVPPGSVEKHTRLRAEAAVLLAEGSYAEAAATAEAALAAVPQSADPGGSAAEAEWLQHLLSESRDGEAQGNVFDVMEIPVQKPGEPQP